MSNRQQWLRARARQIMDAKGIDWAKAFKMAEAQYVAPKPKKPKPKPKPRPTSNLRERTVRDYDHRDKMLQMLGYVDYGNYLKSETWNTVRLRVLKRDNWTCFRCGNKAQTAHHTSYTKAALTGENINSIYSVCHDCHTKTHYTGRRTRQLQESVVDFGYVHVPNPLGPHPAESSRP